MHPFLAVKQDAMIPLLSSSIGYHAHGNKRAEELQRLHGAVEPHGPTFAVFAQLLSRQASLSTADFQCVVFDFAEICRGKLPPEGLNKYLAALAVAPPG